MTTLPRAELPAAPPRPLRPFDPNAPAASLGAAFGVDVSLDEATVVIVPAPYEGTVSSRSGTAGGPASALAASAQVDLLDPLVGEPWTFGIAALPALSAMEELSRRAASAAARARQGDAAAAAAVDETGGEVWNWLDDTVGRLIDARRAPIVLGGEHGVSLGAFRAAAARRPGLGILHVDAHADLRVAYEGFRSSHASVMRRALELPAISRLVQVGLRDFCPEEDDARRRAAGRSVWFTDAAIAARLLDGEPFARVADEIVAALPECVWVSFDIDGLDPALCPSTGTPVPGGLSWREATSLLSRLARAGRTVVGADLVECGSEYWDGYVAAKLLYLLCGVVAQNR